MKRISLAMLALFMIGMAANAQRLPAVAPVGSDYHYGRTVWYDLFTNDVAAAKNFYQQLFGWSFEDLKDASGKTTYTTVSSGGKAIAGMVYKASKDSKGGEWLTSISVENVKESLSLAQALGAKVVAKPAIYEGKGEAAVIADPEGAYVALLHSASGDPDPGMAAVNSFLGVELWSNNQEIGLAFYKNVFKYDINPAPKLGMTAAVLLADGKPAAGSIKNPVPNVRSHWVPYIRVADVKAMAAKAKSAGAKAVYGPLEQFRDGRTVLVLDATGAPFVMAQL